MILGFYFLEIYTELLTDVWDLFQNNMIVGEDGDIDGTEVNRTGGCWSISVYDDEYLRVYHIICFYLFLFAYGQNF